MATTQRLLPFQPAYAQEIAGWVRSATEAAQWANIRWPVDPAIFARWHADPEVDPYVLVAGSTLLGYGELWLDAAEREVELARLLIAPQQHGQGHGQCLVRELLLRAASTAYPTAFIRVVPENLVAIHQLLDVQWPTSAIPTEQPGQKITCSGTPQSCTGLPN